MTPIQRTRSSCKLLPAGWLLMFTCGLIGFMSAAACGDTRREPTLSLGIEGFVKRGHWAQARLESDLPVSATIGSCDGEGFPLRTQTISQDGITYLKIGRRLNNTTVSRSFDATRTQAVRGNAAPTIVSSLQQFILIVGGDMDIGSALRLRRRTDAEAIVAHSVKKISSLPVHPLGYDGVDAVFLSTADPRWLNEFSEQQLNALDRWVRGGGRLVITAGQSAEAALGDDGRLNQFLPGTFVGPVKQRAASGMEAFVKAGTAIKMRDEVGRITGIPTFKLADARGRVLVEDGVGEQMTAWLIQSSHGFGTVLLVSTDLNAGPIAAWKDRPRFLAKILDIVLGFRDEDENERNGQVRHLGFTDLAGQLRVALDQFPGVWLVPFSLIAGVLAAYILLLGPVDYFLLRYFGGRMHWTWVTFPTLVVGFGLLASVLVNRVKSDTVKLNQVDLIDVDIASGAIRAHTWAHLYSPKVTTYSLGLQPAEAWQDGPYGSVFCWHGLPGAGFSGLEGQGAVSPIVAPYEIELQRKGEHVVGSLSQVGIPARSTRSMAGTWTAKAHFPQQQSLMIDRDGLLLGAFTNPLSVTLRDCAIVCDQWYYKLGTIKPGQTFSMDSADRPLNFSYRLMRRSVNQRGEREFGDFSQPWDRASFDLGRIMEMMMFHKAAGGRTYTNLLHQFHGKLDLSDHLDLQTAILMGRLPEAASRISIKSDDDSQADVECTPFCRILIPVELK